MGLRHIQGKELETILRWRRNHPVRIKAHAKVSTALKNGRLIRPDRCSVCQKQTFVVAHHDDYSQPLEVRWLCDSCHAKHHALERRTKKAKLVAQRRAEIPVDIYETWLSSMGYRRKL